MKRKRGRPRKVQEGAVGQKIQEVKLETQTPLCIACQKPMKRISEGGSWSRFHCEDCKIGRTVVVEASD